MISDSGLRQLLLDISSAAFDRDVCNYSQSDLARKAKLSVTTINRLKHRKMIHPRASTIKALVIAVKMDKLLAAEALFGETAVARQPKLRLLRYK